MSAQIPFAVPHANAHIGDALVRDGLLSQARLDEALALQARWGTRLGDILLAKGWVRAYDFYRTLSVQFELPFVDLLKSPPDESLFVMAELDQYAQSLYLPWKQENGKLLIAVADPSETMLAQLEDRYGKSVRFVITSKFDIIWSVQRVANARLTDKSVLELARLRPDQSARQVFTGRQIIVIGVLATLILTCLVLWPVVTLIALNGFLSVFFLLSFGLRTVLTWVGSHRSIDLKVSDAEVAALEDHDLPVYTILVPMYKEPDTLPILSSALRRMDYPLSKLDVKLVLEEDDIETIQAAKDLGLEGIFEIIRVPHSQPRTKPKACNYALNFARGELLTIYDAEDKPEPDQLKKAVIAFRKAPDNVACIQARLNYFNSTENWLTRMFTLEYSLWFDFYLPALEALKIPIPLGGTSNHFKMDVLREANAWDPFNVTEDADLGVRLTQRGYRVGVANSTTFEEANSHVGNWIRQRSRWFKGYMQTYLVHMRKPVELYRSLGHTGFWGFQFFVGGNILTALSLPFMLVMFAYWLATRWSGFDIIFPPVVLYISLFNLIIGNGFFVYLNMLGAFKRHNFHLMPYALTVPAYWLLMTVAAYKGLWQLIHNPFFWEKTTHGLSQFKHDDIDLHRQPQA
ncbi:MAG: glycosyltransferase family 2 protein [Thiobacillus sp.]|nr:glycosyltransferase family 2 protein [Thiobacillus sp.]MDP2979810.1 glycosyltransferase family 2 protein [Thiobacillus sp.]